MSMSLLASSTETLPHDFDDAADAVAVAVAVAAGATDGGEVASAVVVVVVVVAGLLLLLLSLSFVVDTEYAAATAAAAVAALENDWMALTMLLSLLSVRDFTFLRMAGKSAQLSPLGLPGGLMVVAPGLSPANFWSGSDMFLKLKDARLMDLDILFTTSIFSFFFIWSCCAIFCSSSAETGTGCDEMDAISCSCCCCCCCFCCGVGNTAC